MNAGKLIAQIAVLAIVVCCCYGTIIKAIPLNITSPEDLFQVNTMDVTTHTDGLNLTVDFKGSVTSGLPQDVDNVTVTISIGEREERLKLTTIDIGSLKAKTTTEITKTETIPTYALLAYDINVDESGTLTVPMVLEFTFKYMKWQGSYLIDMGIGIDQDFSMVTGATAPVVTKGAGPNDARISISLSKDGSNPLLNAIVDQLNNLGEKEYVMKCGEASISFKTDSSGTSSTDLWMEFTGNANDNAANIMRTYLEEKGELTLTFDGKEYTLEKENAETFLSLIDKIYEKVPA